MKKIDFKKELKYLYKPSAKKAELVQVPEMNFLMVDGAGDPNHSKQFENAVVALFGLSYTLKFMIKKGALGVDYGVLPLEGLFWSDNMADFGADNKKDWKWTLMVMQPQCVTHALVDEASALVRKKKNPIALPDVRFARFSEGQAAQIMHIGPFSEEGPTIENLHQFIEAAGYQLSGKHHEIYLSDIRRAAPEKWKTIIRQAVKQ